MTDAELKAFFEKLTGVPDALVKLGVDITDLRKEIETVKAMKVQTAPTPSTDDKQKDVQVRFLKWLTDTLKGIATKAAIGESTTGGALVPEEFRLEIQRIEEEDAVVRPLATVVPMSTDTLHIPKDTSTVTVAWTDEHAPVGESEPTAVDIELTVKKLAAFAKISNEMMRDGASTPAVAQWVINRFAEAIGIEEDKQALVGTGTPFSGVLTVATNVVQPVDLAGFSDLTSNHFSTMIAALKKKARRGAAFIMDGTIVALVRNMKGSDGHPLFMQSQAVDILGTIYGYPVLESDQMPDLTSSAANTRFIAFGNLRHVWIGDRNQMLVDSSEHVFFTNDQTAVRVIQREAISVVLPNAFCALKTKAV